jgi:hypothetical protein
MAELDPQGAFDDWELALRADSSFALAWENQADMLFQMQKFEDCLAKLDGCLKHSQKALPVCSNELNSPFTCNNLNKPFSTSMMPCAWMISFTRLIG